MKKIINNKLYDTEKAEKIFSYRRKYKGPAMAFMPGYFYYHWADIDVYKTIHNNYFLLVDKDGEKNLEYIEEEKLKSIIRELDADKYIELFGRVDEA